LRYTFRPTLAATAVLVASLLVVACRRSDPEPLVQLVRPEGTVSTAALPRVRLHLESRYVMASPQAVPVRDGDGVMLGDAATLPVDVTLPASLQGAGEVHVDSWLSIRDPSSQGTINDLRQGNRLTSRAAPVVVTPRPADGPLRLEFAIPEVARGRNGLLTVIARPLPPALMRAEAVPVDIAPGSRLGFGFAVEQPGWEPGWPAVRFKVFVANSSGDPVVLFERRIDPANDPEARRWHDASVDLTAVVGRGVRLTFEAEALPGAKHAQSFPVVSNPVVLNPAARSASRRPNVVLVSLDTLRARSVSAYGYNRPTMPHLDRRLAAAGAIVRQVVTPVPFTPPAHMTMLTGLSPCAHGVFDLNAALAPERLTLAEAFRAAGYATAALTEDAYLVDGNGFERGFDAYHENRSEESASPGFAAETFAAAGRWVEEHADRPFFLFIHTYQVHEPYNPPAEFAAIFRADEQNERRRKQSAYEAEIRYTDDVLGRFLDVLMARQLTERTIVVITSDHGEGFGEHGWSGHGFDLHDEALLVPLVVRAPGVVPPGLVVEEQVALADLAPTLLDLAGLGRLPDVQGQSFAGLLTRRDAVAAGFKERALVSWVFGDAATPTQVAVRTRGYKYLKYLSADPQKEQFFDLPSDPYETRDRLSGGVRLEEARAIAAEALASCVDWRKAHPARPASGGLAGKPAWLVNRQELENGAQLERKLRSLGYIK
jgi:arylsulfatase A-like enzyme